ncbi:16S rRNA (uracil(1498)-N(3))-methyltransferase [Phytomonospora endophytica]|uniref:Ribosomal RNA small subunit methyltransferase E n=1 Tax=Phytomonospora endophytica TaxID=714109 RepID=A0A841FA09_9ACTN|nr:16S rRNA (uracil(1498)-N(3))-methyltransferase [Phytomonospora endophytica]MBB6034071.1 16S rRNA (uracil1498-N3)-methyltransferase [Phytomonospora endophytica]GIG66465.1 ribosomal RNA small subunit methyltransferase E [Phytomonospora endophytica]
MSAPLFLVDALPAPGVYRLDGPEGRHAADVQRLREGERLLLADGDGGVCPATVTAAEKGALILDVGAAGREPEPSPSLTVVQGLAKGDRGERAVQAMTEVGVDVIVPWSASRSVVQWRGDRGDKAHAKWAATAREAAKQARRARVPKLAATASTKAVAARIASAAAAFVLHEEATAALSTAELPADGEYVLVVGPEGGVSGDELAVFEAAGAVPVRLGREVLRTSTAGVAALAALSVRLGRW